MNMSDRCGKKQQRIALPAHCINAPQFTHVCQMEQCLTSLKAVRVETAAALRAMVASMPFISSV